MPDFAETQLTGRKDLCRRRSRTRNGARALDAERQPLGAAVMAVSRHAVEERAVEG
jgi:hypothetical protein